VDVFSVVRVLAIRQLPTRPVLPVGIWLGDLVLAAKEEGTIAMLTPEMRRDYERAAVALETHRTTPRLGSLGLKAYRTAFRRGLTQDEIDNCAARLLRECLEKGTELP
jgi:hypothetical protein